MTDVVVTSDVSVVICAYTEERWEDLRLAIDSVRNQSMAPLELILVIDYCPALYRRAYMEFEDVVVVENSGSQGLSDARNTGVNVAHGSIVAFLDDDAAADSGWLEHLLTAYANPSVAGAGGSVIPSWVAERPGWFPREFDWVVGCSHSGMPSSTERVRNFVGANMSFRRDLLLSLGGFSRALGRTGSNAAGCEETELCLRAANEDSSELVYEPEALVVHRVPRARGTWKYFLRRCYGEGISKARVTRMAGTRKGLSAERRYLSSTIPRGIVRSIAETVGGKPSGLLRAVAMIAGTTATTVGYATARVTRTGLAVGSVLLGVLALWLFGIHGGVALGKMTDLGLVSVLPRSYWIALFGLTASFCWSVRRKEVKSRLLALHIVLLLLILHATPTLLYETLRYSWAWKHVAITDFVVAHHGVDLHQAIPALVAYQDWPGFFSFTGLLTSGAGLSSALGLAAWGPFVNELLYAGPLVLIFKSFTPDRRIYLPALWIFYLGNWIGQDYFSPQGFDYFLYLVVITICLRHLRSTKHGAHDGFLDEYDVAVETPDRRPYYAIVVVLAAAIVSSHQLTPFMLVSALSLLAVARRLYYRSLPLVAALLTVGWIGIFAQTFVRDNFQTLISGVGAFFNNASVHQVNGTFASPDQLLVSKIDRLLSAGLILLAIVGYFRNRKSGQRRSWMRAVLLVMSPMVALAANSYGGEIVFRVLLFSLPFLALLGASAFQPAGRVRASRWTDVARFGAFAVLAVGFVVSNYGKERANYFSPVEVASMNRIYSAAPAGSYLTGFVGNDPWPLENYQHFTYYWYTQVAHSSLEELIAHPVKVLVRDMSTHQHSYVIFSASDLAEIEMTGLMPAGAPQRIVNAVLDSGRFQVVESNSSVLALTLKNGPRELSNVMATSPGQSESRAVDGSLFAIAGTPATTKGSKQ